MGTCVIVSLWCESLITNIRFRVFFFFFYNEQLLSASDVKSDNEKLPNDSERPLSYYNLTNKKTKWLLLRSRVFPAFSSCYFYLHLPSFRVRVFLQMTRNFALV